MTDAFEKNPYLTTIIKIGETNLSNKSSLCLGKIYVNLCKHLYFVFQRMNPRSKLTPKYVNLF